MIKVWCDGACRPNPGKGGIGIVFEGNIMSYTISERVPGDKLSNNAVEFLSLCRAMTEILKFHFGREQIVICSDSELLVCLMNNEKKIDKGEEYLRHFERAKQLSGYFSDLTFKWIPREENTEANLLASKAFKQKEVLV